MFSLVKSILLDSDLITKILNLTCSKRKTHPTNIYGKLFQYLWLSYLVFSKNIDFAFMKMV